MAQATNEKPDRGDAKHEGAARPGARRTDDNARPENRPDKTDERLDEALEETFPSSDPISVTVTK